MKTPSRYLPKLFFLLSLLQSSSLLAQTEDRNNRYDRPKFNRKEEVIYDNKRYRKYNNYLTAGGGFAYASNRVGVQRAIGADFQFHIRRQQFQIGGLMSGEAFLSNNHVQAHVGYGLRRERNTTNLAAYIGPTWFTGVEGTPGVTIPVFYTGFGGYACVQAVSKFTYDIGIGAELFGEVNFRQTQVGLKFILFFSGAYRGNKTSYSPNPEFQNRK